jgi:hypothetical protein
MLIFGVFYQIFTGISSYFPVPNSSMFLLPISSTFFMIYCTEAKETDSELISVSVFIFTRLNYRITNLSIKVLARHILLTVQSSILFGNDLKITQI